MGLKEMKKQLACTFRKQVNIKIDELNNFGLFPE